MSKEAQLALSEEVEQLEHEADMLVLARKRFDAEHLDPDATELNKITLAALSESVYSGAERALSLVAREFDRSPVVKTETWHRDLILQMAAPVGSRSAVLSPATAAMMNDLRGFRHKVRSHYGSALMAERVCEVAVDAEILARAVATEIRAFLDRYAAA